MFHISAQLEELRKADLQDESICHKTQQKKRQAASNKIAKPIENQDENCQKAKSELMHLVKVQLMVFNMSSLTTKMRVLSPSQWREAPFRA